MLGLKIRLELSTGYLFSAGLVGMRDQCEIYEDIIPREFTSLTDCAQFLFENPLAPYTYCSNAFRLSIEEERAHVV
jgi:hypothetical protein